MSSRKTLKRGRRNSQNNNNTKSNRQSKFLMSKTPCRHDGHCRFFCAPGGRGCRFIHKRQSIRNFNLIQEYVYNNELPEFFYKGDTLFNYNLNTTLLLFLFFDRLGEDVSRLKSEFMDKQFFINELVEYFRDELEITPEEIGKHIELLVKNTVLFNRRLIDSITSLSLRNTLTAKSLRDFTKIEVFRGFKTSYHKYLEVVSSTPQGGEIVLPLPLSTSISENTCYRFLSNAPPYVIWRIVITSDKFHQLPTFLFEQKAVKMRLDNRDEMSELEILLPIDTQLKLLVKPDPENPNGKNSYLGFTEVKRKKIKLDEDKIPLVYTWEFMGLDSEMTNMRYLETQEEKLKQFLTNSLSERGVEGGKKKKKRRTYKKKNPKKSK